MLHERGGLRLRAAPFFVGRVRPTANIRRGGRRPMAWDWQVFCKDTIDGEIVASCFGKGGDRTYLDWMLSAWGWTLSVDRVCAGRCAARRLADGHPAHDAEQVVRRPRQRVDRTLPQHPAAGADLPLVPRDPVASSRRLRSVPPFLLVVFALGFFTSARIAEQVKAGIQALPKGQRYAGLAVGPDAAADLPLRAAADGVPHRHPAADERVDEHRQELVGRVRRGRSPS